MRTDGADNVGMDQQDGVCSSGNSTSTNVPTRITYWAGGTPDNGAMAIDELLEQAARRPMVGWDFSWLGNRLTTAPLPWE